MLTAEGWLNMLLVRTLDFVAVTDADLDNDTYESALKQFEQNNNKQAISGFMAYTASFPRDTFFTG
jgi:TolA-binding protein